MAGACSELPTGQVGRSPVTISSGESVILLPLPTVLAADQTSGHADDEIQREGGIS